MIKFENEEVWGFEHAFRGMRNPMNSWDKSDSHLDIDENFVIGEKDRKLALKLIDSGSKHRKFLRQIFVSVDITAPLYWWKEFDTYKVGTTANSCSTMHKITEKEFTLDDFSHEHIYDDVSTEPSSLKVLLSIIDTLNQYRHLYLVSKYKGDWWQMIQLLPSSYNQKRTVTMTYENLVAMMNDRMGHKLTEWTDFVKWELNLPNSFLIRGWGK